MSLSAETQLILPLSLVATLLCFLVLAVWRLANFVRDLREALNDLRAEMSDKWSLRDQEVWALEMERVNRDKGNKVWIPDVRHAPRPATKP